MMKYIKLFEDFNQDIYIEDAKYIIISHLGECHEIPIDTNYNIKDILRFELDETPTEEEIKRCEEHLNEEGFFLRVNDKECVVSIVESLEEYCLNWLNINFGDLKPLIKGDKTFYVDEDNKPFFYYYPYFKNKYCYIDYDKIWSLFIDELNLKLEYVKGILNNWLELTYDITGHIPASWIR